MTRKAGIHIYNQSYLDLLINPNRKYSNDDRPETKINLQMKKEGHPILFSNIVAGLHDFEQYYKDLWLKGYVFSGKSQYWVNKCIARWREKSKTDLDYLALLAGYNSGLTNEFSFSLSWNAYHYGLERFH